MFRGFNLNNENDITFKATLYKNARDKIMEIPNEFITKVTRNLEEIDEMDIDIPKFIGKEKRLNPLFIKMRPLQSIVVNETDRLGKSYNSRFVIIEENKNKNRNSGNKIFKCKSWEYKLKDKQTSFQKAVVQLKSDEIHIAEGIIDKFIKECPDWSIGSISEKSRKNLIKGMENVNVNLFTNYTKNNITEKSIIWEKDVTTNVGEGVPLYLSIEYKGLKTYNADGTLLITNNIINPITDCLYRNIKKITCRHFSETGNRFGSEYTFLYDNDTTEVRTEIFTNVISKSIKCDSINLIWETGNIVENEFIKYINIEDISTNWLDTLVQIQDQFNSLVLFDSYKKTISVVSREEMLEDNGYILSYESNVSSINISTDSIFPNCMKVIPKTPQASIVSENIYGGDLIYNYEYAIKQGLLSDSLVLNLKRYDEYLMLKQNEWQVIKNAKMAVQGRKTNIDSEISSLNGRIKTLTSILASYISASESDPNGENQKRIKIELDGVKDRLSTCLSLRADYTKQIQDFDDDILVISNDIKRENATDSKGKIFSSYDIEDLREIEIITVYSDDYFTIPYSLLCESQKRLKELQTPQMEYSIDCPNLTKVINNKNGWKKILALGSLCNIDNTIIDEFEVEKGTQLRILSFDYSPKEDNISGVKFGNKYKLLNKKLGLSNVGKTTNNNNNVINSYKDIWTDSINSNNFVGNLIENGLNLNAQTISGRTTQSYIEMSSAGLFISNQLDVNKQVFVGSDCIGITHTGFSTSDIAIDSNGVTGRLIVGKILLGQKLYISSDKENGEFYIGDMETNEGFGLSIKEGLNDRIFLGTELVGGIRKARLRLIGKDGELALSEEGIVSEVQYNDRSHVDSSANMISYFRLRDNVNIVKECILTVKSMPFMTYTKGMSSGGSSTVTSSSEGGEYNSTGSSGGNYSESKSSDSIEPFGDNQLTERAVVWSDSSTIDVSDGTLQPDRLSHRHKYYYYTLPHVHNFSISIPSHQHPISIPKHNHQFTFDTTHTHNEAHGCFYLEGNDNKPSKMSIKVNGMTIMQDITSDTYEINIGAYLKKNFLNEIVLTSATKGIFHINVYCKSFIRW